MKPSIVSIIQNIISSQNIEIGEIVSNLYGATPVNEAAQDTSPNAGSWIIAQTSVYSEQLSPSAIVRMQGVSQVPVIQSDNGILTYTSRVGTTLASTVVNLPEPIGVKVEVICNNKQINVFVGETIYKRSFSSLSTTINLPAGKSILNIVVAGNSEEEFVISTPPEISLGIEGFVPATPRWLDSGSLVSNYIDPITGVTGVSLNWYSQPDAGAWNAYRIDKLFYGIVSGSSSSSGLYNFTVVSSGIAAPPGSHYPNGYGGIVSGTPPVPGATILINSGIIGTVLASSLTLGNIFNVVVIPDFTAQNLIFSGCFFAYNYINLGRIAKLSASDTVSFIDSDVRKNTKYFYTLDAESVFNPSIKSRKAITKSIVAGDVLPPGNITITGLDVLDDYVSVRYTPPSDEDYLGTRVVKYYMGSGVGQIANTLIHTDFGLPSLSDSMVFQGLGSGTYYFLTFDQLYNTQYIFSGVPFFWNGSGTSNFLTNQRPTISIGQLSSSQIVSNGHDPTLIAGFLLTASDIEFPGSVQVQYILNSGTSAGWITAAANPFTAYVGKSNRDTLIRARAFDGSLYSDELMTSVDFDDIPEISSVFDRYVVASGAVFISGAVDDDTKSLRWYITTGAETGDPTITNPTLINNLASNKTFNFSFNLSDGQRKVLIIVPYADLAAGGTVGILSTKEFIRPPRTIATVKERALGGAITRVSAGITLSPIPDTAITYEKLYPIVYGTVTSGTATTLTDNTAAWAINQFATNYDAVIVEGVGINQSRQITSNVLKTLVVSPAWVVIPTSSSRYEIRERFRQHNEIGKATAAGPNHIADSTKTWITNLFESKNLVIYSGTGAGQMVTIVSGTSTIQSVTPAFSPTPDSTSGYKIFGERTVTKDSTRQMFLQYYSYLPSNNLTEEAQTLVIDDDNIPVINSGSFIQINNSQSQVTIMELDEDVKFWALYSKKGSWPTLESGVATSGLDTTYRIHYGDTTITTLTFNTAAGWWYNVIVPYDSYGNSGDILLLSGQVFSSPPAPLDPTLSNLSVTTAAGSSDYNKLRWNHNSAAEKPGGSDGDVTVRIWAYRNDQGPATETEITEPATRYAWYDSETGSNISNSDDGGSDTTPSYGSFVHLAPKGTKSDPWLIWYYTVKLYKAGVLKGTYETEKGSYYLDVL